MAHGAPVAAAAVFFWRFLTRTGIYLAVHHHPEVPPALRALEQWAPPSAANYPRTKLSSLSQDRKIKYWIIVVAFTVFFQVYFLSIECRVLTLASVMARLPVRLTSTEYASVH
jgi:hypothetical protein